MKELLQALAKAEQAHRLTADLEGRSFGLQLAVVANIDDPMSLGRIQVMLPSKGAKTLSNWLVRITPSKYISVPLVNVGDTVVVGFFNGDPNNGAYLGAINNLPQPPAKEIDNMVLVNKETSVVQDNEKITLIAGQASLSLTKDGSLTISGVSSVTINNKQIATIDAVDNDGDRLTTRGW